MFSAIAASMLAASAGTGTGTAAAAALIPPLSRKLQICVVCAGGGEKKEEFVGRAACYLLCLLLRVQGRKVRGIKGMDAVIAGQKKVRSTGRYTLFQ